MSNAPTEKLQKILARAGLGSRREIEQWILAGRVQINKRVAHLGDRASEKDTLRVDGREVKLPKGEQLKSRVIAYHKPAGEVTTRDDEEGRDTVFRNLPTLARGRWISVGRLDINTMGLLLFTNDGELAHRLMHPSYEIQREYAIRVLGQVEPKIIERLKRGVELEDGTARFESLQRRGGEGANVWYHGVLKEGRNREVRRLWESQGITVSRLIRVRFGPVRLPEKLRQGHWADLSSGEIKQLKQLVSL